MKPIPDQTDSKGKFCSTAWTFNFDKVPILSFIISMKKCLSLAVLISAPLFAQTTFPLGNGLDKWGVPLKVPQTELSLRLGARLQSLTTVRREGGENDQDFQARRVRFLFEAELEKFRYYMDIRNDSSNADDKGEQNFNIGDAYVEWPLSENHLLRLFRAKVDVSRTESASSAELLFVNRPFVADEAAVFVNHNRRATNVQLLGNFAKKMSYQIVAGDGVQSGDFNDASGEAIESIERQNFMVGAKLRFHPFSGWEDLDPSETYFGEGQHFSFGIGFFNTSKINLINENSVEEEVSRNLTNFELSTHYRKWFLSAEYFIFDGVIEDHTVSTSFNKGKSEGWYVQGEKVFPEFHFLAPFARYESWDRFLASSDHLTIDQLYGLNWYLNGNRFKISLAYEKTENGKDSALPEESEAYHFATAWQF